MEGLQRLADELAHLLADKLEARRLERQRIREDFKAAQATINNAPPSAQTTKEQP